MLCVDDLPLLVDEVAPAIRENLALVECTVLRSCGAVPVAEEVERYLELLAKLGMARPAVKADAEDLGVSVLEELVVVSVPGQLPFSNRREVRRIEHQDDVLGAQVVLERHGHLVLTLHPEIGGRHPHLEPVLRR